MKKLIFLVVLSLGLSSSDSPYLGAALSVTEKDDGGSCRAASSLIAGVTFSEADFAFSIEARHSNSFNGSIADTSVYAVPKWKGITAFLGYGRSHYLESDLKYSGMRYGLGYEFGAALKFMFFDILYDEAAKDYRLSTGFKYYLEPGFLR